ncbi:MAG: response regulator [Prevotella sp.]|nr:response regulator [Prevotella sp.]
MNANYRITILLLCFMLQGMTRLAAIELKHRELDTTNGLPSNYIISMVQDPLGFVWLATDNGLCRYDGYFVETFRHSEQGNNALLLSNKLRELHQNPHNGLLFIRLQGEYFSCYDTHRRRFIDYNGSLPNDRNYSSCHVTRTGDSWLWYKGKGAGCLEVKYQDGEVKATEYSRENGSLKSNNIRFIHEDSHGNIWIATDKALYAKTSNSIGGLKTVIEKYISYMAELDGKIYLTSTDGHIYTVGPNLTTERLKTNAKSLSPTGLIPYQGQLLVVTPQKTFRVNPTTGEISSFHIEMGGQAVFTDDSGNYYMNDLKGRLHYFDLRRNAIYHFDVLETNLINKPDTHPISVTTDANGYIWIITKGNGFFIYDPTASQLQHFSPREKGVSPIETDYIQAIMNDRSGNIWISQENMGISILSTMPRGITRLFVDDGLTPNYSNFFRMVRQTADGRLWAGNFTGDAYQVNVNPPTPITQHPSPFIPFDIGLNDDFLAVCKDREGHLWTGTRNMGISVDGHHYHYDPNDTLSLAPGKVFDILCDSRGRVWVAVNTGALCLALPQADGTYKFRRLLTENSFMRTMTVLLQTSLGHIVVGCANGLIVFHPDSVAPQGGTVNPHAYHYYHKGNSTLGYYETRDVFEHHDTLWLASSGGGLYYIPTKDLCQPAKSQTMQFHQITTEQGLADNTANTVIADRQGNLWIGMNRGLTRIDRKTQALTTYYLSAHKLGEVYSENSACLLPDGQLLFGTKHGLIVFHPDSLSPQKYQHPSPNTQAHITSLSVNGLPYDLETSTGGQFLPVRLSHHENSLIIRFSDLSYEFPYKAEYEYMLRGFDTNWSPATRENEAIYKDLKPGRYTFRVRLATNPEHVSEMQVTILQPWWLTWWARILYLLAAGAIIWYIARLLLATYRLRNRIRINRQINQFKQQFFMNVSHEFRTPLTIIQGSMERMRRAADLPASLKQPMSNMQRSTDRLLRLVNQLLEVDKLENGKLSLRLQETDVVQFVRQIVEGFTDVAENKRINLQFLPFSRQHTLPLDHGMMDKILYNLISNALKYTPSRGEVTVRLKQKDRQIMISVEDTGPGVPREKQAELFTRFTTPNRAASSLGIGLHLTRQLVEAHHGEIRYEDNPGGGSIFTLTLPDTDSIYTPEDFLPTSEAQATNTQRPTPKTYHPAYKELPPIPLNQRRVLIVEDDEDVMTYLKSELSAYFLLELASDGQEALQRLHQQEAEPIDLIVSDIRMPRMDGMTLLKKVRADDNLFDIPFILLTAISSVEKQVQGLRFGADDYLPKPFSPTVLVARCLSLIQQRDKLRTAYTQKGEHEASSSKLQVNSPRVISKQPESSPSDPATILTSERDRNFLKIVEAKIGANLSNPEFVVDDLARVTGYSRTQFYSKMSELTGYSPKEYIRRQRMNRAAELLHQGEMITVAEVAYQCGFSDPLYFSRCFKQYYGMSPSRYQKES